jgi:hypothetical protein
MGDTQEEQSTSESTKIHRHFPKSDFMQTRIVAPKLFAMAKRGLNDAAMLGRLARIFPFLFCPLLVSFGRLNQNQKYEDPYQINRAGGAHTGIGRLRLER